MSHFILLVICLILGILLRGVKRFPQETSQVLNYFILFISLPALVLNQFHAITIQASSLLPALMPWILFLMSWGFIRWATSRFQWSKKTEGTLVLMSGLGNTSFIGFPFLEALYGPQAIATGILIDQLGTFLVFSTLALLVASFYSGKSVTPQSIMRKILLFPPVYALLIAIILKPLEFHPVLTDVLNRLGSTISPLALVSVGFQLRLKKQTLRHYGHALSLGLIFKLILAPAFFSILAWKFFSFSTLEMKTILAESAMAPMISTSLIVAEFELDSELSSLMLGIGIPLSFMTVPLWNLIWYS